jgi:hypothetical protein
MKNYFIILNDRIELMYRGRIFPFDLNDGDREDYWNSFTYNGKELDINYYPVLDSLTIYNVHDETGQIDTSQFEPAYFVGDLTGKYVIIDTDNNNEFNQYNDSKEIIIYNNEYYASKELKSVRQFYVRISNLLAPELFKIFTQKIDKYEKAESRRSA